MIVFCLAAGIFIACFSIRVEEIREIKLTHLFIFYLSRFILVPLAVFYVFNFLGTAYTSPLFLFAALPPGISTPAMNRLFGGNVALSFSIVILGNLLVPFVLPSLCLLTLGDSATLDVTQMFYTLIFSILTPILFFQLFKNKKSVQEFITREGSFLTTIFIGITIAVAVGKGRSQILQNPLSLLPILLISTALICLVYAYGWFFMRKTSKKSKITYALGSGAINISLGVTLALLYFPTEVSLFLTLAEVPWILAFMPFKKFIAYQPEETVYARTT